MTDRPSPAFPFTALTAVVCLAAAAVGGFFGYLAGILYAPAHTLSAVVGAACGLAVAVFWSRAIKRHTLRAVVRGGKPRWTLVLAGTGFGMAAGALATVGLHLILPTVTQQWEHLGLIGVAQMFGLPAGAALGLACGLLWWLVCAAVCRRAPTPPQPPAPEAPS